MGERKAKISGKKAKGNNSSGRSLTLDFTEKKEKATPKPRKPVYVKREVDYSKKPLTDKQEKFCQFFIESNNGREAAIQAGYSENGAEVTASRMLRAANVAKRIKELRDKAAKPHIATGEQVMQFFSDVMTGKIKDQFGLETSVADRTKAAVELAKRTVDLDQKLAGKPDTVVQIKLDWNRENSGE